jgi:hypothetical protein
VSKFKYFITIGIGVVALIVFLFFANIAMIGNPNAYDGNPGVVELNHSMAPSTTGYIFACNIDHPGYLMLVQADVDFAVGQGKVHISETPSSATITMEKGSEPYSVYIIIKYWNGAAELTETFRYSVGAVT